MYLQQRESSLAFGRATSRDVGEEETEKKDHFPTLKKFLEAELNAEEQKEFFGVVLPFILKLAPLIQVSLLLS